MKKTSSSSTRGWALVTVVLFTLLILAMSAGLLSWATTELKVDLSHKRRLAARNAAESVMEFGAAQASLQVQRITDFDVTLLDPAAPATTLQIPPTGFFKGSNIDPARVEIVGKVSPPPPRGRFEVKDSNPANLYSQFRGKSGRAGSLTLLARATTLPDYLGRRETIYLKKSLTILDEPVLQYAAFYNMDFEAAPGPALNIYGPVHTNGDLWVSKQSNSEALSFRDRVSATGIIRKGFKVQPNQADGSREASQENSVEFMTASGKPENLKGDYSGLINVWRDSNMLRDGSDTDRKTFFATFANKIYGIEGKPWFLQTNAHGVKKRALPGQLDNYVPDPNPTDKIIDPSYRNVPRALIERPLNAGEAEYVGAEVEKQKMSRKAGLYILVNALNTPVANVRDPAGALIPGGFVAGEYRAYVRRPGSTLLTSIYTEVRLPGQPRFGTHPGHTAPTLAASQPRPVIIVKHNQMVDMRRYYGGFKYNSPRADTNVYRPKVINIIEVDMTALKIAVERTVNNAPLVRIFPYDTTEVTASNKLVQALPPYNKAPYASSFSEIQNGKFYSTYRAVRSAFGDKSKNGEVVPTANDQIEGMASEDWDGSIYIESIDADFLSTATESVDNPPPDKGYPLRRDPGHRSSGVRLINGRGPVVSAGDARLKDTAHPCSPGLTLSTNDALYILGHLNADGDIHPALGVANLPTTAQLDEPATTDDALSGNNSSLFPDRPIQPGFPTEQPLALVADAITILSQPTFTGGVQTSGWSDLLSYLAISTTNHSKDDWYKKPPAPANRIDGAAIAASGSASADDTPFQPVPATIVPASPPTDPSKWGDVIVFRSTKFPAAATEIAAGFIIGLTPSAKHPTDSAKDGNNSGGLHNLPRFLEDWGSSVSCIRGSMVVMFESQVASEPWSLRVYGPPVRFWGYNNMFRNFTFSDDIPATRRVGSTSRDGFVRLKNQAEYNAERTTMWPAFSFPATP